jgi:endoglucanase
MKLFILGVSVCVLVGRCLSQTVAIDKTATYPGTLDIVAQNGQLMLQGTNQVVTLKGINYFGFESFVYTVHGLWSQNLEFLLDFLQNNNFNAMRIPLPMDMLVNYQTRPSYQSIDYTKNPNLVGLKSIEVLDYLIQKAAERCIVVLLDYHVFVGGDKISELWYNDVYTEDIIIWALKALATRYLNQWNVIGIDLKNEPHGRASWGDNNPLTDWRLAAERIGNEILSINPKLLIFVEGVQDNSFPPNNLPWGNSGNQWGGGLSAAVISPVRLNIPQKLVYESHVYGPDVWLENYFTDVSFPNNMPNIWENQWGYLSTSNYTLVIGEFGGKEIEGTLDRVWSDELKNWFLQKNITNTFFWCLNPNSQDTAGILSDDWSTPDNYKLNILQTINPTPTNMCQAYNSLINSPPPPTPPITPPITPPAPVLTLQLGPSLEMQTSFLNLQTWLQQVWTDGDNNTYLLYNGTIQNLNMPVLTEVIMPCINCVIVQYWNCEYNTVTDVFSFHDAIKYSGGLRKGQNLIFGVITKNSYFNISFSTTYGING